MLGVCGSGSGPIDWALRRQMCTVGLQGLSGEGSPAARGLSVPGAGRALTVRDTLMILPQVHLRKPCYDFYFL
jgi:hypothetical protein